MLLDFRVGHSGSSIRASHGEMTESMGRQYRSAALAAVGEASCLSYYGLSRFRLRGMRNGNWRRLNDLEKGLYNCALRLGRWRGRVVNAKLLALVWAIIRKLLATVRTRILQVGEAKAQELLAVYATSGVFLWAPEMKVWLRDSKAIFYLGVTELFGR